MELKIKMEILQKHGGQNISCAKFDLEKGFGKPLAIHLLTTEIMFGKVMTYYNVEKRQIDYTGILKHQLKH